ncbi:Rho guanine nucleotide exchange factor (GEF) 17, partial [Lunasporangiospora selenospora]
VFVDPLYRSMETEKPFIPRANALFHLLTHVSALMAVSVQLVQRLEACVKDDVWSDESSLIGTIFLEAKEPLTIFLRYGQAYGKGMKALRTLMKSKRATISFASPAHSISSVTGPAGGNSLTVSSQDQDDCAGEPRLDKRRSLPSIFVLNSAGVSSGHGHSTSVGATSGPGHLLGVDLSMSNGHTSQVSSRYSMSNISNKSSSIRSTHSGHESMTTVTKSRVGSGSSSAYAQFLRNCAGNKETTGRFSLADLLILPIQRVTRYCLLLKDLKRHTDTGHEDYVGLVHALEQVHTLALATNNAQPASMRM